MRSEDRITLHQLINVILDLRKAQIAQDRQRRVPAVGANNEIHRRKALDIRFLIRLQDVPLFVATIIALDKLRLLALGSTH